MKKSLFVLLLAAGGLYSNCSYPSEYGHQVRIVEGDMQGVGTVIHSQRKGSQYSVFVLTCSHLVNEQPIIQLQDKNFEASIVAKGWDLALLRIYSKIRPDSVAFPHKLINPAPGTPIRSVRLLINDGVVGKHFGEVSNWISYGGSCGAVFNAENELVGISSRVGPVGWSRPLLEIGWFAPITRIGEFLVENDFDFLLPQELTIIAKAELLKKPGE